MDFNLPTDGSETLFTFVIPSGATGAIAGVKGNVDADRNGTISLYADIEPIDGDVEHSTLKVWAYSNGFGSISPIGVVADTTGASVGVNITVHLCAD